MKKMLRMAFGFTLLAMALTACSDNAVLSESSAKKAIKKESVFVKNANQEKITTGYYEVTLKSLDQLCKLKAAGVITLRVDSIVEQKTHRRYSWYGGMTTYTEPVAHHFAAVELTKAGKKYETEQYQDQPAHLKKYLAANEEFEANLPDYLKAVYQGNGQQPTETIAEAEPAEETDMVEEPMDEVEVDEGAPENNINHAYEQALSKVTTEEHYVVLFQIKLVNVYEVKCSEEQSKNATGSCKFVYELSDITPFGYVLVNEEVFKTRYRFGSAELSRYEDLGWKANVSL